VEADAALEAGFGVFWAQAAVGSMATVLKAREATKVRNPRFF
jgi:hypothetical protein